MMEGANQNHRRSSLDTESRNVTPSKAGTKRLFSNRGSRQLNGYEEPAELDAGEDGLQSGKRPRNSDWPLPKASPPSARPAQRHRDGTNSPSTRRARSQVRPSKFMEGSMNDKTSHKPPAPYIGDEYLREQYEEEEAGRGRTSTRLRKPNHHNEESSVPGRSDASKNSIFRFGKSIAATFNPTNWRIWNKQPQIPENEETAQQRILRERQEKAARIYQELKSSGEFRDTAIGTDFYEPIEFSSQNAVKHDSGIHFNEGGPASSRNSREHSLSRDEKRKGHMFHETPNLRHKPRGESPASHITPLVSQSSQNSPKFKKPSLSNIRRSFANDSNPNLHSAGEYPQPRRIPSRKELQKQQKLVKRVSDLESKLDVARRQLIETVGEPAQAYPQPNFERGRPRFVPGALPSLPSERLLSGYVAPEDEEIGRAVTTDHPLFKHPMMSHALVNGEKLRYVRSGAPSEDRVLPSVEKDGSVAPRIVTPSTKIMETGIASTSNFSDSNDGDYEDDGEDTAETPKPKPAMMKEKEDIQPTQSKVIKVEVEDEETLKKLINNSLPHPSRAAPQPPKTTPTRKRKSFVGHAYDGGEYEPDSEPESASDSELSAITSDSHIGNKNKPKAHNVKRIQGKSASTTAKRATTVTRPPRKLQKTSTTTSSPKGAKDEPLAKKSLKNLKPTVLSPPPMPTAPSNRLANSKIPNLAPPKAVESDFSGLRYNKPSADRPALIIHEDEDAVDVPPVPKLPKTVRMPSGEIVSTEQSNLIAKKKGGSVVSKASSNGAKLTKPKPESKTEEKENVASIQGKQSFEWPEDVF